MGIVIHERGQHHTRVHACSGTGRLLSLHTANTKLTIKLSADLTTEAFLCKKKKSSINLSATIFGGNIKPDNFFFKPKCEQQYCRSFSVKMIKFFPRMTQQHSTDRKKDNMPQGCAEKDLVWWMETGYANTAAPGLISSVRP